MTKEKLLKASIDSFKDNENPAILIPYEKVTTNQGFSYIVEKPNKKENISCAIHFDVNYDYKEDKGSIREVDVEISTRVKLKDGVNYLCKYQNLIIFLNSYDGYNETMKQYLYRGKALTRDKLRLLEELKEIYGYSLYEKINKLKNFVILPKYLSLKTDFNSNVVLYESLSSEPLSLINRRDGDLSQLIMEEIELILVNFTRQQVMVFIKELEKLSLLNNEFGFSGLYQILELNDIDTFSTLKGITYKINMKLCYNIAITHTEDIKTIKTVIFKMEDQYAIS